MDWLVEVFTGKTEQAQLVTMFLSVTVAIFVVLLNQWFITRRARKDTLINKIEALYIAIEEYDVMSDLYLRACYSTSPPENEDYVNELSEKAQSALKKIGMYLELYFSEEKFELDKYRQVPLLAFLRYQSDRENRHPNISEELHEKLRDEYSFEDTKRLNHVYDMKRLVVDLMNSHRH